MRLSAAITSSAAVLLSACAANAAPQKQMSGAFLEKFDRGLDKQRWYVSHGWSNGSVFNVGWMRDNVTVEDGVLILRLNDRPASGKPHSGGEVQLRAMVGYGTYEVRMRPPRTAGMVSAFFLYSGPQFGTPWHEIDVEFLGKDTKRVQFNTYTNGKKSGEALVPLGFDASEAFHTYRIEWKPETIVWSVNGHEVYRLDAARHPLPEAPQKLMLHIWAGQGTDGWLGRFRYPGQPLLAAYDCVSYVPLGEKGQGCSD